MVYVRYRTEEETSGTVRGDEKSDGDKNELADNVARRI